MKCERVGVIETQITSERYRRINRGFDPTVVNSADKLIDRSKFPGFPQLRGSLLFAGQNGFPDVVANTDVTAVQPRFGLAYQITDKLVFRGGFGRFYLNPNNDYIQNNGFSVTTPFVGSTDAGRTPIVNILTIAVIEPNMNQIRVTRLRGRV